MWPFPLDQADRQAHFQFSCLQGTAYSGDTVVKPHFLVNFPGRYSHSMEALLPGRPDIALEHKTPDLISQHKITTLL
jgi:hypothetical protein